MNDFLTEELKKISPNSIYIATKINELIDELIKKEVNANDVKAYFNLLSNVVLLFSTASFKVLLNSVCISKEDKIELVNKITDIFKSMIIDE